MGGGSAVTDTVGTGASAAGAVSAAAAGTLIVALHLGRGEPLASPQEGHDYFVREAKADGVTPVELGAAFEAARKAGEEPYRDVIHPNATGQRIIATTLLPVIEAAVRGATTTTTTRGTR